MDLVVYAGEDARRELLSREVASSLRIHWIQRREMAKDHPEADAYMDLEFEQARPGEEWLNAMHGKLVIVNSVVCTLAALPGGIARMNGWPGFLERPAVEVAAPAEHQALIAELFSQLNRRVEWVPDTPGFISARIISMIINEAYHALEEKLSSRDEIDTAMRLGTNYPMGPFEWGKRIGLGNIHALLKELSGLEKRYLPAALLEKEALNQ